MFHRGPVTGDNEDRTESIFGKRTSSEKSAGAHGVQRTKPQGEKKSKKTVIAAAAAALVLLAGGGAFFVYAQQHEAKQLANYQQLLYMYL